jgi:hypothetical protein
MFAFFALVLLQTQIYTTPSNFLELVDRQDGSYDYFIAGSWQGENSGQVNVSDVSGVVTFVNGHALVDLPDLNCGLAFQKGEDQTITVSEVKDCDIALNVTFSGSYTPEAQH